MNHYLMKITRLDALHGIPIQSTYSTTMLHVMIIMPACPSAQFGPRCKCCRLSGYGLPNLGMIEKYLPNLGMIFFIANL